VVVQRRHAKAIFSRASVEVMLVAARRSYSVCFFPSKRGAYSERIEDKPVYAGIKNLLASTIQICGMERACEMRYKNMSGIYNWVMMAQSKRSLAQG